MGEFLRRNLGLAQLPRVAKSLLGAPGAWCAFARRRADLARQRRRIAVNFREIDAAGWTALRAALRGYFSEAYLRTEAGRRDADEVHLRGRLEADRRNVVPWLDAARSLAGARILEIGCGTGSSTAALAEQGARVIGVDIDARALEVAQLRCELHGARAELAQLNANEAADRYRNEPFDFIIFYASLEHMVHEERVSAIGKTWEMLPEGALWCVVECPNRLWYYDSHTSWLPFYLWLPDDLGFAYSRFSPRENFSDRYREATPAARLEWARRGRGVSYHELELAMGPAAALDVVSSLGAYRADRHAPGSIEKRYARLLAEICPGLHAGFFEPYLNLIIRKATPSGNAARRHAVLG
ncbi:MAG: methyltransferase domain-containing protein [Myxococcales bacterium]|nr:methyltransferase domain-containing protein [Myxococcales bacterium]MDH5307083.1 methyltransferase domain-containing protein [Myxococcales bacterium]MDH5567034.1 methyltransferase domain-containing protein [Myxococcales bacterium]